MRVTTKGQVTIPIEIREKLGIFPGTEVNFVVKGDAASLIKVKPKNGRSRGEEAVARLTGKGTVKMTTDEVMRLTRDWSEDDPR
jgi:AbrB family looped-hinge helix DNA binding protein